MTDEKDKKDLHLTALYKAGGRHKIHGGKFDYKVVPADDIEAELKNGWFLTTPDALAGKGSKEPKKSAKKDDGPTRDEVKEKADELGIEYAKNISTVKLQKLVEDKLDELDKA